MVKKIKIKIVACNIWGANEDFHIYPSIIENICPETQYSIGEIKTELKKKWSHYENKDHGSSYNYLHEYMLGAEIKNKYLDNFELIETRGVHIFDFIPRTKKVKLSSDGEELKDLFFNFEDPKKWMKKLIEIFLKYDIRLRALLRPIFNNNAKLFIFKKNKNKLKFLFKNQIYFENNEKELFIFHNDNPQFNQLLEIQPFENIGPFIRSKFRDFYGFEIDPDDDIIIVGDQNNPPSQSQNYSMIKKLILLLNYFGEVIENNNGFLKINFEKFAEIFDRKIVEDFLSGSNIEILQTNLTNKFLELFSQYCNNPRFRRAGVNEVYIGKIYKAICKDMEIDIDKEDFFMKMFKTFLNKKYTLLSKKKGLPSYKMAPEDPKNFNIWEIEFY